MLRACLEWNEQGRPRTNKDDPTATDAAGASSTLAAQALRAQPPLGAAATEAAVAISTQARPASKTAAVPQAARPAATLSASTMAEERLHSAGPEGWLPAATAAAALIRVPDSVPTARAAALHDVAPAATAAPTEAAGFTTTPATTARQVPPPRTTLPLATVP